jgi:D-amino-acid oxidase
VGFTSYTLNPPRYLAHLASSLRSRGVPILRHRVSSLDEAYSLLGPVSLVINATGLGSRTLLGVEDASVHPIRGQTVTVRAPSVVGCFGIKDPQPGGQQCYVIPRPGPEGHVTLGGTFLPNNYSTLPDPDTAERIVKDAYKLCPQLASGSGSGTSRTNSWRDIQIVSHNVGLRPARTGGMRLELENRVLGRVNMEQKDEHAGLVPARGQVGRGREVGCVHAYGIGPAG